MKYFLVLLFFVSIFACSQGDSKPVENSELENEKTENLLEKKAGEKDNEQTHFKDVEQPPAYLPQFQRTLPAGKISFKVECKNEETSTIHVACDGLEKKKFEKDYQVAGQLVDAFVLDLDKDSFSELYLVVKETDDSGNYSIQGISSYRDNSAGDIFIKETDKIRLQNTDRVYVENDKLMRSFKAENGTDATFTYGLTKGETSFILQAIEL